MTPIRRVIAPSFTSIIDFLAACFSRLIFLRIMDTNLCLPSGPASAGKISNTATESVVPRISATVSSSLKPVTSTIGLPSPCPTPTILSPTFSLPDKAAGPPATSSLMVVYSSFSSNTAPIPSNDNFIEISKSSEARIPK